MSITIKTLQELSAKENELNAIYQTNDIVITNFKILFLDRLRKMQYSNVPLIEYYADKGTQFYQPEKVINTTIKKELNNEYSIRLPMDGHDIFKQSGSVLNIPNSGIVHQPFLIERKTFTKFDDLKKYIEKKVKVACIQYANGDADKLARFIKQNANSMAGIDTIPVKIVMPTNVGQYTSNNTVVPPSMYDEPNRKRFIAEYNQIKADFQKKINEFKADKNKLNYEAGFKLQKMLNEWSGGTPKTITANTQFGYPSWGEAAKMNCARPKLAPTGQQPVQIKLNGFPYTAMNNFYYANGTPNIENVIATYNNGYPESNVNNIQNYNDQLANEISEIVHKKESLRNTADYPKWQAINAGNPPSASDVPPPPPSYMAKIGTVKLSKLQIGMLAAGPLLLATSINLLIKK